MAITVFGAYSIQLNYVFLMPKQEHSMSNMTLQLIQNVHYCNSARSKIFPLTQRMHNNWSQSHSDAQAWLTLRLSKAWVQ